MNSPSLSAVLKGLGYTHTKAGPNTYAHHIFDPSGSKVYTGPARDVWLFLHGVGLHVLTCPTCKATLNLEVGMGCAVCAPLTIHSW